MGAILLELREVKKSKLVVVGKRAVVIQLFSSPWILHYINKIAKEPIWKNYRHPQQNWIIWLPSMSPGYKQMETNPWKKSHSTASVKEDVVGARKIGFIMTLRRRILNIFSWNLGNITSQCKNSNRNWGDVLKHTICEWMKGIGNAVRSEGLGIISEY